MKIESLTRIEKVITAASINLFGSGDHPVATVENLEDFKMPYVNECLGRALDNETVTAAAALSTIIEALNEEADKDECLISVDEMDEFLSYE